MIILNIFYWVCLLLFRWLISIELSIDFMHFKAIMFSGSTLRVTFRTFSVFTILVYMYYLSWKYSAKEHVGLCEDLGEWYLQSVVRNGMNTKSGKNARFEQNFFFFFLTKSLKKKCIHFIFWQIGISLADSKDFFFLRCILKSKWPWCKNLLCPILLWTIDPMDLFTSANM